jgi:hypothetical protein
LKVAPKNTNLVKEKILTKKRKTNLILKKIMSDDNSKHDIKLFLKSEVITIEEDEVQLNKKEPFLKVPPQSADLCFESLPEKSSYPKSSSSSGYVESFNIFFLSADNNKPKSSIKILCVDCPDVVFEDRSSFESHWNSNHKTQPIVFACVVCEYNAKKFILLRNHVKRHLEGRYECSDCPTTYSQKSDLNYHKTTVHGLKVCRKCNMEFETAESFEEHKNSHVKSSVKVKTAKSSDKSCPDCGKVLQTSGGLFTHRKMHLEKPKFRCEVSFEASFVTI